MPVKMLQIPTADGVADAVAAFPNGGGRHPSVLLYMDGFGVRPVLIAMANELSQHGYYVLVPNLFYRHGPAPVIEIPAHIGAEIRPGIFDKLLPLIHGHSADRAARDAEAYLGFLAAQPEVVAGPAATVGYCWGGVLAVRAAAAHPDRVAAVAAFHAGPMVTAAPDSPHRLIAELTVPFHLGHAEGDMSPEVASALDHALTGARAGSTSEVYAGTIHGFTMSDTDAFNPAGLRLHWERLVPLLRLTLNSALS